MIVCMPLSREPGSSYKIRKKLKKGKKCLKILITRLRVAPEHVSKLRCSSGSRLHISQMQARNSWS